MPAEFSAIDVQKARVQAGGNPELAHELFALLRQELTNVRGSLQTLDLPVAAGTLADIAHKLRSSARYCAAPRLERAADQAEKEGRAAKVVPDAIAQSRRGLLLAVDEILAMPDPYL